MLLCLTSKFAEPSHQDVIPKIWKIRIVDTVAEKLYVDCDSNVMTWGLCTMDWAIHIVSAYENTSEN